MLTGGLKTEAGKNRSVPVPNIVLPYLEKWLDKKGTHIFCGVKGGHMTDSQLRSKYYDTLKKLNIKA